MGTAKRDKSMPKTAGVKSNYCGRTRNAVSDGTFADTRMNAQGSQPISCPGNEMATPTIMIVSFPHVEIASQWNPVQGHRCRGSRGCCSEGSPVYGPSL